MTSTRDSIQSFLDTWHRIVRERDIPAIGAMLAPDVSLGAPPYWDKLQGHAMVEHLLGLVVHTIEDFTYHREWTQGNELALEFTGHIGDLDVQGIDLITLGDDQLVTNIDVLMRPVNSVIALREVIRPQMVRFLAEAAGNAPSGAS